MYRPLLVVLIFTAGIVVSSGATTVVNSVTTSCGDSLEALFGFASRPAKKNKAASQQVLALPTFLLVNADLLDNSPPVKHPLEPERGVNDIGDHPTELHQAVGSDIVFDACFERMKPILAIPETGSGLTRLRRYILRATEFLVSEEGAVMARLLTGIHDDKRLRQVFLERYVKPRRQIQRRIIEDAIASGELKATTDPELLIDALNGPLFFRWLQGHAPLDKSFAKGILDRVIPAFQLH